MCEAFQVAEIALMIRVTRGRSRRPNHMHSHLDALQAMRPVDLRRVPRESPSVAKRASFYIAFGRDSCGFKIDFGRFGGGKMEAKIDFLEVFLRCFFGMRFSIDLGWILEARYLKNQ